VSTPHPHSRNSANVTFPVVSTVHHKQTHVAKYLAAGTSGLRCAHPRISNTAATAATTCSITDTAAEDSRLLRVKIHVDVNFI
jgi:hypothetical protein